MFSTPFSFSHWAQVAFNTEGPTFSYKWLWQVPASGRIERRVCSQCGVDAGLSSTGAWLARDCRCDACRSVLVKTEAPR